MKNLPAIVPIATIAVLMLLAVAASFIDTLQFASTASYVLGFSCAVEFLLLFISDYSRSSHRPISIVVEEAEAEYVTKAAVTAELARRRIEQPIDTLAYVPVTVNMLTTMDLQNEPATLSFS